MQIGVFYNKNAIKIDSLTIDQSPPYTHIYQNSFLTWQNSVSWDNRTWHTTPFGACYTVWATIGADPVTGNLNTGWGSCATQGVAASASVSLPAGCSTVFFAVFKNIGTFDPNQANQISFRWLRSDGVYRTQGYMGLKEFQDTTTYSHWGYDETVYSAMVYPVVCYTSTARTLTVELSRTDNGPGIWLGRPVVLPGICSWFITQ
jgi:hypothetical protein